MTFTLFMLQDSKLQPCCYRTKIVIEYFPNFLILQSMNYSSKIYIHNYECVYYVYFIRNILTKLPFLNFQTVPICCNPIRLQ